MEKEIQEAIELLTKKGYEVIPPQSISVINEEFESWWELYSYKKGKKKTFEKWEKLSVKDRKNCIKATPRYVENTVIPGQSIKNDKRQYRMHPLTYLNGKRWEDEIYYGYDEPTTKKQQTELAFARTAAEVFNAD